jgi:type I restriction enzyme M protein
MSNRLKQYFADFEIKFANQEKFNNQWYCDNTGCISNISEVKALDVKGAYSEEWYRARMVWSLVESGMFPKENICVELRFPKGSEGNSGLEVDLVIFKNKEWKNYFEKWNKKDALPSSLKEQILVVMEAKKLNGKQETAISKQLFPAMAEYIGDYIFGVYFDNQEDLLIFKKEKNNFPLRYNLSKMVEAEKPENTLSYENRDQISSLPKFETFLQNIESKQDLTKLNFATNDPITQQTFEGEFLGNLNRIKQSLSLTDLQGLVVEFLTLKVADEREVKGGKKYFEFYITPEELENKNEFRKRIKKLYESAKRDYPSILNNCLFDYSDDKNGNTKPSKADDELFLIEIIQNFQTKIILNDESKNFNQIIFSNFGDSNSKAKDKQFFTPIPLVQAIVDIINPQKGEEICDPCCGICDFLAMSFRKIYKDEMDRMPRADNFYGFDLDDKILKLAELNLVLNGDGNAVIKKTNSLVEKYLEDRTFTNAKTFTTKKYNSSDWTHKDDNNLNIKQYDIILTNPPFGKGQALKTGHEGKWDPVLMERSDNMNLYELWQIEKEPNSIDLGIIFLENAYKSLKEGGRMAIVLSNSIASIQSWKAVRGWFMDKMRIVALFDLPSNTFGETGVSTTVIIAYKPKTNEQKLLIDDYEIFTREIVNLGYEVKTKDRIVVMPPVYKIDETKFEKVKDANGDFELLSDLPELVKGFKSWLNDHKHTDEAVYNAFGKNLK